MDAFQVLKADGLLEKVALPDAVLSRIPKTIGTFPIHDKTNYAWAREAAERALAGTK